MTSQWVPWRPKSLAHRLFAWNVCSGGHETTYQSTAPLAFVRGIQMVASGLPTGMLAEKLVAYLTGNPLYSDVAMSTMASQITSTSSVCSTFVQADMKQHIKAPRHWPLWGEFKWWPVDYPRKGPVTQEMFPFHDVIMPNTQVPGTSYGSNILQIHWFRSGLFQWSNFVSSSNVWVPWGNK